MYRSLIGIAGVVASLLARGTSAAQGARIVPSENYELDLAPDLHLSFDGEFLRVHSPLADTRLAAPYGSSHKGFANFIDHATVTPSGEVTVYYRSYCDDKLLQQVTSLSALRARLLIAQAEQLSAGAAALIERAHALAPTDPTAAVARAVAFLGDSARASRLLAPALATARFETYFEVLRRAPQLRDLPLLRKLRAARPGVARLDAQGSVFATSGSLIALRVDSETEADCSSFDELLLLDGKNGEVVFRRPTVLRDSECHETFVSTSELNQLLADFGFEPGPASARVETLDHRQFAIRLGAPGSSWSIDIDGKRALVHRGSKLLLTTQWPGGSPRWAAWLPTLRTFIVTTNRDSDVCEGLPMLELLRVPDR